MDALPGVLSSTVGFMGGSGEDADYKTVYAGTTKHVEIVAAEYDEELTSYRDLLWVFWKNIQPTQSSGQFGDVGAHYRSVIFAAGEEQRRQALASLEALKASAVFTEPVSTSVEQATDFYPASTEHQGYYQKNPEEFRRELEKSGRQEFLACGGNPIRREHLGW